MFDENSQHELVCEALPGSGKTVELNAWFADTNETVQYDKNFAYKSPLVNPFHSDDYNWQNNWIPSNCVNYIKDAETVAKGIAEVAENVIATFEQKSGKTMSPEGRISTYQIVTSRWGIGAKAEVYVEEVLESKGFTIENPKDDDEGQKIDTRTKEMLIQTKQSNDYNDSKWNMPKPNTKSDENKEKTIMWVKDDGTIMKRVNHDAYGQKKYEKFHTP